MANELVTINDELTHHTAEHEVLLSFTDDSGAYTFRDWWEESGRADWEKYNEEFEHVYK